MVCRLSFLWSFDIDRGRAAVVTLALAIMLALLSLLLFHAGPAALAIVFLCATILAAHVGLMIALLPPFPGSAHLVRTPRH